MTLGYKPNPWIAPLTVNLKSVDSMVLKQILSSLSAEITRLQKSIDAIVDGNL